MGSYDSYESDTPRPSFTSRVSDDSGSSSGNSNPEITSVPQSDGGSSPVNPDYDGSLPTLVALGGGLTPSRIVKKIPDEIKEGKLIQVVKYLINEEVLSTEDDVTVAEAVKQRMDRADYRAIINAFHNYHNDKLRTDDLSSYLQRKERQTEEGTTYINFCDIAIVSHDEGGKGLEEKL
ncbi:hypothetical protein HOK51_04310 [Candidatus Woesearchaeota archaeon]|jgi:hypothetical protein|nr:hypothetical protein [Candidatus Woesearchaeota archaeon]MBT6519046.1 hypothetical protein [Candidatus Woesearchaeota archaeon]MBT7367482.1 hypothetical protein [Candidatus Woesearchaeota archaeon]